MMMMLMMMMESVGGGGGEGGGGGGGKTGENKMHYGRCARVANERLTEGYPELEAEYEIQ